jgi:hypothetical protein
MITIQIESVKLNCEIQFEFDIQGRIIGFKILGENLLSGAELTNFLAKLPQSIGILKEDCVARKIPMTEIKADLSFDTFWKKYGNIDGSKIKAKACWDKLSDKNKNLALNYINRYKQSLGSTTQAYATTYLNGQYWIK